MTETPEEYQARVESDERLEEYLENRTKAQAARDRVRRALRGLEDFPPSQRELALNTISDFLAKLDTEDQKEDDYMRERIIEALGEAVVEDVYLNREWDEETLPIYIRVSICETKSAKSWIHKAMNELHEEHQGEYSFDSYGINWYRDWDEDEVL